jgi:hypothetical protein
MKLKVSVVQSLVTVDQVVPYITVLYYSSVVGSSIVAHLMAGRCTPARLGLCVIKSIVHVMTTRRYHTVVNTVVGTTTTTTTTTVEDRRGIVVSWSFPVHLYYSRLEFPSYQTNLLTADQHNNIYCPTRTGVSVRHTLIQRHHQLLG